MELEQRAQQHRDCLRVQKRRAACATLPGKLTTTRSVPAEKPAVTIGKRKKIPKKKKIIWVMMPKQQMTSGRKIA